MSSNSSEFDGAIAGIFPPFSTPTWGSQIGTGAFTVRAVAAIRDSPDAVLETLLDTATYPDWNRFVPRVTFPHASESISDGCLREGVVFTEHVDMFGNGRPSGLVRMRLLMTTLEETGEGEGEGRSYKVVWLGKGYPPWALRSERVHAITPKGDGTTIYDVWETFSGPLAILVKLFVGKTLVKRFRQWNTELQGRVHGQSHTSKR